MNTEDSQKRPAGSGEPGEFTRMFQLPKSNAPSREPDPTSSAEASDETTGEFSRLFRSNPAPQSKEASPPDKGPQSAAPEAGEFTRLFKAMGPEAAQQPPGSSLSFEERTSPSGSAASQDPPVAKAGADAQNLSSFASGSFQPANRAPESEAKPERPAEAVRAAEYGRPAESAQPSGGEFTRLFRGTPQPQRPERFETRHSDEPPVNSDNEVTKLFEAPAVTKSDPSRATPPSKGNVGELRPGFESAVRPAFGTTVPSKPAETAPPVNASTARSENEPGSFTQLFQQERPRPSAPPPASPSAPPAASRAATDSEFARFFDDPLPSATPNVNWNKLEAEPARPLSRKPAGDFTQMFGKPSEPTPSSGPGVRESASDIFERPRQEHPKLAGGQPEIDDFGKMFPDSPKRVDANPAAAAPKAASPATQGKSAPLPVKLPSGPPIVVLILIIGAILVLAGCALYYFVLRK